MELKVIYKMGNLEFETTAKSISQAYEIALEIVNRSRARFMSKSDSMDFIMEELVKMKNEKTISYENAIFKIKKVESRQEEGMK